MDFPKLKSIIEGLLFLSGEEGLSIKQISEIVDVSEERISDAIEEMKTEFAEHGRGVQILKIAGMVQLGTLPEHAVYFEKLAYSPARTTLSQAALETLAIVAYRQPITRVEIEEIRGVKSERAIHTLVNKDLIVEVGRAEAIGRPILYGTTRAFWITLAWVRSANCRSRGCLKIRTIWKKRPRCCLTSWMRSNPSSTAWSRAWKKERKHRMIGAMRKTSPI